MQSGDLFWSWQLESESCVHLHAARAGGTCDAAERRAGDFRIGAAQVYVVQRVEGIRPDHNLETFLDTECLAQIHIERPRTRAVQREFAYVTGPRGGAAGLDDRDLRERRRIQ